MEEELKEKIALLGIEYITLEESLVYNESGEVNHTIWSMRGWGDDLPLDYFRISYLIKNIFSHLRINMIISEQVIYYEQVHYSCSDSQFDSIY